MRLLLDERYTKQIAEKLRDREHDVVAVTERTELIGAWDEQLFRLMAAERRAIVTENWAHFSRLMTQAAEDGLDHYGVLFTSAKGLPRGKRTIGRFVRVLDEFLQGHPAENALLNSYRWLP